MKIADKRNKNKMKQEHKMNNLKATNEVYALEHGPYKVVSFVNLGGSMEVLSEKYFANKNMNLVYEKERRMNFLFVNTESFNDLENAYITRVSDIVVFVINSENPDADRMKLIKKHIPSCLFVIMDKKYKKSAKKFVKKNLPDTKIVEYNVLLENMCILKQVNTVVSKRPYMVPFEVRVEDEFMYFKGFMKSGLQSSKIIINGKHTLEIEEVKINAWIKGSDLNMSGEEKSKFAIYNDFNDMLIEMNSDCEKENLEQFRMEIEDDEVEDDYDKEEEIDFDDISENSEKEYPSLVQKYYEYRGVRNLTTCDLPVEKYPEYYKDLIFFKDFKRVEKYVLSRKSVIDDNQMVEIKVRYNPNVVGNIFVLFSNYEFEDCKTILNYTFNADVPINDDKIIVDFGHKLA